jgi:hypothetical protein
VILKYHAPRLSRYTPSGRFGTGRTSLRMSSLRTVKFRYPLDILAPVAALQS